jgi:multidrug/hemolysin transport system permease protein
MTITLTLVRRNLKVFFRDKAAVFFTLLSTLIVLGLYLLFLRKLNVASLEQTVGDLAYPVIDSWMFAGILTVIASTSTLGALSVMVEDRYKKINRDFLASPLHRSALTAGYLISSFLIGMILSILTLLICQLYSLGNGFPLLSPLEYLELLGILALTVFSGNALMFFLVSFLKTMNAYSTLSTIVGTLIGFITGVYMPVGLFPEAVQVVVKLMPPSHGAVLMRQIMATGPIETAFAGLPASAVTDFRAQMGVDYYVGGALLPVWGSLLFLLATGLLFFALSLLKMRKKEQ